MFIIHAWERGGGGGAVEDPSKGGCPPERILYSLTCFRRFFMISERTGSRFYYSRCSAWIIKILTWKERQRSSYILFLQDTPHVNDRGRSSQKCPALLMSASVTQARTWSNAPVIRIDKSSIGCDIHGSTWHAIQVTDHRPALYNNLTGSLYSRFIFTMQQ